MGSVTLFFTSLGLSMDACAISISNGMCYDNIHKKQMFSTAAAFGFFQAFMPILGYLIGSTFSELVTIIDHWIALILLGFIGGQMIYQGIRSNSQVCRDNCRNLTPKTLFLQAIATSIDALAVGIGFAVMKVNILGAALSIGIVTFINSIIGSHLGRKSGQMFKQKAEIFGGIILVGIGVKIFIEHTM